MKKFYLDFEITAYLFIQERLKNSKDIYFERDELITFVDIFCTFLNKKDYVVLTKIGKKLDKYEDYAAVAKKICSTYTEAKCTTDKYSNKTGYDSVTIKRYFNENTFNKMSKAFDNISSENLTLFVEYEAYKTRLYYQNKDNYKYKNIIYKSELRTLNKKEEQELDNEENVALA